MNGPQNTQPEQELKATQAQFNVAQTSFFQLQRAAQNLRQIAQFEAEAKKLKEEIRLQEPAAPLDTPEQIAAFADVIKSKYEKAQTDHFDLEHAVQNLRGIAQFDADDVKLQDEITRLQKLYPPKA